MSIIGTTIYLIFTFLPIIFIGWLVLLFVQKRNDDQKAPLPPITFPKHFLLILGLLIVGYNVFVHQVDVGIGYGLMLIVLVFASFISLTKEKRTPVAWVALMTGIVAALLIGARANGFVQFFVNAIVALLIAFGLVIYSAYDHISWRGLWLIKAIGVFKLTALFNIPRLLSTKTISNSPVGNAANHLKTIIFSFILLSVFAVLLSSADPVFANIMEVILNSLVLRLFISIVIAVLATIIFSVTLKQKDITETKLSFLSYQNVLIPVVLTSVLIAVFLVIQTRYLFWGSDHVLIEYGLTYSEYVRKGFIELLVASIFGSGLGYLVYLKQQTLDQVKQVNYLKVVNVVLIVEILLLLLSAFQRNTLYIDVYGLTRTRIIGNIFLASLAIFLIVSLAMVIYKKVTEKQLFYSLGGLAIFILLSLNVLNIDHLIATAQPSNIQEYDYFYINNLSEDAVVGWKNSINETKRFYNDIYQVEKLTETQKAKLADLKLAMLTLHYQKDELEKKYSDKRYDHLTEYEQKGIDNSRKWQSFNYSEHQAYQYMQENEVLFNDTLECLINQLLNYQLYYSIDLYDYEYQRRYSYDYPFLVMDVFNYYSPTQLENGQFNRLPFGVADIQSPPQLPHAC